MAEASPSSDSGRLKVFISYSRVETAFAQELVTGLELLGFDAYLDKEDIAPGEPWEERLANLIRLADTVVFVISPESVRSTHCAWEIQETVRSSKRLVPVIVQHVPDGDVPEPLRRLNYVFFTGQQSFAKSLGDLARALRADAGWIREHTRYGELAARWTDRGKPEALLLRSTEIDDAKRWIAQRPKDAPEISAVQLAFIDASTTAAREELAAKARLRRRVMIGLGAAAVVFAILMALFGMKWQEAEATKADLERAHGHLREQAGQLAASNARLQRKLALRAAPFGNQPYDVPAGWFQIATGYAGAVGFVERADSGSQITASGAIVNAARLNSTWTEQPVLVTGIFVVAEGGEFVSAVRPNEAQLVVFGPNGGRHTARLGKILWQSTALGVSVSSIEGTLPPGSEAIDRLRERPAALDQSPQLAPGEIEALFDSSGTLRDPSEKRPIVFVGYRGGRQELTLSISHLLGTQASGNGMGRIKTDLLYTYVTAPGSSGSPIFDAETGDLIGIHLNGHPCPGIPPTARRCYGSGTSVRRILAAIRGDTPNP